MNTTTAPAPTEAQPTPAEKLEALTRAALVAEPELARLYSLPVLKGRLARTLWRLRVAGHLTNGGCE